MKLTLTIETTEPELVMCICVAHEKVNQEPMEYSEIKPFVSGDIVLANDVENMLIGCCLAQLAKNEVVEMKVVDEESATKCLDCVHFGKCSGIPYKQEQIQCPRFEKG